MYFLDARQNKIKLKPIKPLPPLEARGAPDVLRDDTPLREAQRTFFEMGRAHGALRAAVEPETGPPATAFRESDTGIVRTFRREIVMRFRPETKAGRRAKILEKYHFAVRRTNSFVEDQLVVYDGSKHRSGEQLLDVANECALLDEVVFATPNFVSEYRRGGGKSSGPPRPPSAQWHLPEVSARGAWKTTLGRRRVVIAILDDGVDLEHVGLRRNARLKRDPATRDTVGRDFFLPDDHPDHFNPRPKVFLFPYDLMRGNDIHGTPCAGVAAGRGPDAFGVAPRCRILPVKLFHADAFAPDDRVADAIRYAAIEAHVVSCSWTGPMSVDIQLALEDARELGRKGRGVPIFCATGNESRAVGFPARDPNTIAVGASTDRQRLAAYSNVGPEVDVVAPSSGGTRGIFTTDVSRVGCGFNPGDKERGDVHGLYTNDFGGTSSATPLAAGIAALMLSANWRLSSEEIREKLRETADKIGSGYGPQGFSPRYGYGRVNAAEAVAAAGP